MRYETESPYCLIIDPPPENRGLDSLLGMKKENFATIIIYHWPVQTFKVAR
jgi:hypothetical protein